MIIVTNRLRRGVEASLAGLVAATTGSPKCSALDEVMSSDLTGDECTVSDCSVLDKIVSLDLIGEECTVSSLSVTIVPGWSSLTLDALELAVSGELSALSLLSNCSV